MHDKYAKDDAVIPSDEVIGEIAALTEQERLTIFNFIEGAGACPQSLTLMSERAVLQILALCNKPILWHLARQRVNYKLVKLGAEGARQHGVVGLWV